jgi:hypothetical protein
LRPGRFLDTQGHSEETEDARDGATADAGHSKQLKGEEDQVDLVLHGTSLALRLELAQASLGLLERCGGAVALWFDPRPLLAPGAMVIGSLCGLVLPLMSAVSDCGQWAHDARSGQDRPPRAPGDDAGRGPWPKRIERSSA